MPSGKRDECTYRPKLGSGIPAAVDRPVARRSGCGTIYVHLRTHGLPPTDGEEHGTAYSSGSILREATIPAGNIFGEAMRKTEA